MDEKLKIGTGGMNMEKTDKFSYSFYEDFDYSCEYDSIDEALEAAKLDAKNADEFKNAKTVYIGRVYRFVPEIEVDQPLNIYPFLVGSGKITVASGYETSHLA